jgi:hypothetical protein
MTGRHRVSARRRRVQLFAGLAAVAGAAGVLTTVAVTGAGGASPKRPAAVGHSAALGHSAAVASASTEPGLLPPLPGGPRGPAHSAEPARSVAPPVRLSIPSIGVDTALETLQLHTDGSLAVPSQWGEAGWYAGGVRPGNPGPAVIAGHVDSINGPAVFYRLRELRPGAVVVVRESTGATLQFIVDRSVRYPKDRFPTEAVYGPTPLPELRLITCTGDFDFRAHSYLDNLVVSAHLG